jgi:hypothetical protein
MSCVDDILSAHPALPEADSRALRSCIQACAACSQACTACADSCLSEPQLAKLIRCVRLNLDCADICTAAMNVLLRQTQPDARLLTSVLQAVVIACRVCGMECDRHAEQHDHCRVCSGAAQRCERAACDLLRAGG